MTLGQIIEILGYGRLECPACPAESGAVTIGRFTLEMGERFLMDHRGHGKDIFLYPVNHRGTTFIMGPNGWENADPQHQATQESEAVPSQHELSLGRIGGEVTEQKISSPREGRNTARKPRHSEDDGKTGWVKVHRKLLDHGWFGNHKILVFWLYCLLKASHQFRRLMAGTEEVQLRPGQFIFGRRRAAEETGLTEQQIRTCIDSLRRRKNLTINSTNKFSIVSIVKWDTYQNGKTDHQPANQPSTNQQVTSSQPHTITKECNKNTLSCDFEAFYDAYPKKKGRKKAEKVWKSLSPSQELFQTIMGALERQKRSSEWKREKGRFIPLPEKWIDEQRWDDELQEAKPSW